ncbi:hypothetical protein [Niastella populi]|uniref:Uncharacterized protein n=1 Tax=Niastella populi TaxID=550983 RepID=A0A1V9GAQ8_9BACT|nr:hypothetical protein [Niastella populi]OQP67634.1 hypothetical protein A4R26_33155 [Niastella populi]
MKNLKPTLASIILGFCVIPLILYLLVFAKNGVSAKAEDWANFATFVSLFIGICNLILFAILTYYVQGYNESNNKFIETRSRMLERPIISFSLIRGRYWIQNIGNGPAINIIVKSDFHNNAWKYGFIWHSLQATNQLEPMDWTTSSNIICATYSDSMGHDYISYMENDSLITIDCQDEKSIKKFGQQIEKAKLNAPSITWRQNH